MLSILDVEDSVSRGGRQNVKLSRYLDKQIKNIDTAIKYYQSTKTHIHSSHILMRLMLNFDYGDNVTDLDAFSKATDELRELCLVHGITTSDFKGDINEGSFNFEDGCAIMSVQNHSLVDIMRSSWEELKPISIVYRETANYTLHLPLDTSEMLPGFGAITIDIPAMAAKFIKWRTQNRERPSDLMESTNDFIARHLLAPLLYDQNRLAYLNMMAGSIINIEEGERPFAYTKQTENVYKEVKAIRDDLMGQTVHHSSILKEYPGFDLENVYDLVPNLTVPYETENNKWFILLAEAPIVEAALNMAPNDVDQDVRLRFNVYTRMLNSSGVLRKSPSKEMNKLLKYHYDRVSDMIPT